MVAKRRHHQTTGPSPSTFSRLLRVDRLHGLLEFGAYPFSLEKNKFGCGCKEAPSPDHGSTAKQIQPVDKRGQGAELAKVWG